MPGSPDVSCQMQDSDTSPISTSSKPVPPWVHSDATVGGVEWILARLPADLLHWIFTKYLDTSDILKVWPLLRLACLRSVIELLVKSLLSPNVIPESALSCCDEAALWYFIHNPCYRKGGNDSLLLIEGCERVIRGTCDMVRGCEGGATVV